MNFRKIFLGISITIFVVLPILSLDYGITGDERFHSVWGKICYDFYKSGGKDTTALNFDFGDGGKVIYYGPSVDLFSEVIMDVFHIDRTQHMFELKHIINSLVLACLILFGGLIAVFLKGWRAGVLTLIFLLTTPRMIADGMANPKDSVFASFYIITIYFMFRIVKDILNPNWKHIIGAALGLGMALGNRIGGLILIMYFGFFLLGYIFYHRDLIPQLKLNLKSVALKLAAFLGLGYGLGVLFWPYAFVSPIAHVKEALDYFTNQPYVLKTLFEGSKIDSNALPNYYIFKWISLITPEITLIGVLLFLFFILRKLNFKENYFFFCLLFTFIFPIAYLLYKKSGLYNGIRHLAFIIPPLIIMGALGVELLLINLTKKMHQNIVFLLILIGLAFPITFMARNHTFELCYFNTMSGGMKKAQGNYDTDYFGVTLRKAVEWLYTNEKLDSTTKIAINYTPFNIDYYLKKHDSTLNISYVRFGERDQSKWDYYLITTQLISEDMVQNGVTFPPKGTIKTIDVSGIPMTAIVKKSDYNDYYGKLALDSNNFQRAIPLLIDAVTYDPYNELSWSNLGLAQLNVGQFQQAIESLNKSIAISPENVSAMNILGYAYLQSGNTSNAQYIFQQIIEISPNFPEPYRILSQIYQQQGNTQASQQYASFYQQLTGGK